MTRDNAARFGAVAAARVKHDGATLDRIIAGCWEGDPLADALVARFKQLPGRTGWRMLDAALAAGGRAPSDAPDELSALLESVAAPPSWVDFDLIDAGSQAFWRAGGAAIGLTYTYGSLAFGYQSAGLVRPLAATGRLERMAQRRVAETARWTVTATRPGALRIGAPGFVATVRLRMVHALIRAHLLASDSWQLDEWGVPISASDGFATAIGGFFIVPGRALRDIGVRFTAGDLEALTRLWAWVGHLMGVPEDLLPRSYARAREMIDAALDLDAGPNEDSPRLLDALLHHGIPLERVLPGLALGPARAVMAQILGAFTRRWMGAEMADRLSVPGALIAPLVPLVRPVTAAREAVRLTGVLGGDNALASLELRIVERMMERNRTPAEISPDEVADAPVLDAAA